jgi:outer membrane immunogenic protein
MRSLLLAGFAVLLSNIGGPALATDMSLSGVPAHVFSWTSCFLGAHIGGGWARKDATDPVQLVQDSFQGSVTTGVTTIGVSPSGLLIGGQMGCDYRFGSSNWMLGTEGAFSGANLRGNANVGLPLGNPGD